MDADAYMRPSAYLESLKKTYKDTARRRGDRRRHRGAHRRTDPLGAGQHPRRGKAPDPEHHPADGLGRGHLPTRARTATCTATPRASPPPLPRHGERQAGRRLRRHRQVFRHRPRVGAARAVPAAAAHLLALDSFHGLVQPDVRQPVRHLPDLLFHHVVRRSGGPFGAAETRNERRESPRSPSAM